MVKKTLFSAFLYGLMILGLTPVYAASCRVADTFFILNTSFRYLIYKEAELSDRNATVEWKDGYIKNCIVDGNNVGICIRPSFQAKVQICSTLSKELYGTLTFQAEGTTEGLPLAFISQYTAMLGDTLCGGFGGVFYCVYRGP